MRLGISRRAKQLSFTFALARLIAVFGGAHLGRFQPSETAAMDGVVMVMQVPKNHQAANTSLAMPKAVLAPEPLVTSTTRVAAAGWSIGQWVWALDG